jgi:hypothetical protein
MLLKDLFKLDEIDSEYVVNGLDIQGQDLIDMLPSIQQCDEFKNCKLHTTDLPAVFINGPHRHIASTMHGDGMRYTGHCWIRSIMTAPLMYDPVSFKPMRKLVIRGLFNVHDYEEPIVKSTSVYADWADKWTFKL